MARNEAASIEACLNSIADELAAQNGHVTVCVNGSTDATAARARAFAATGRVPSTVAILDTADKANAINVFFYSLRPRAAVYFFVDGYAEVRPGSFRALAAALDANETTNAASGVPSRCRDSAAMVRDGGIHGSLHALRGAFVERLVARGITIPPGAYVVDGFIGAAAMFDLDPLRVKWDRARVAVAPVATWRTRTSSPWSVAGWRRRFNRRIQQARGRLQNPAISEIVKSAGFEALAGSADDLALEWVGREPAARQPAFNDLFGHLAMRRMHREATKTRKLAAQDPRQFQEHETLRHNIQNALDDQGGSGR